MFRRHTMQPDCAAAGTDFAVDRLPFGVAVHTCALEAERLHQEIVRRDNILVGQSRNDAIKSRHDVYPFMSSALLARPTARSSLARTSAGILLQPQTFASALLKCRSVLASVSTRSTRVGE